MDIPKNCSFILMNLTGGVFGIYIEVLFVY